MIQVAHRVFDILELLSREIDREFRLGEIAEALDLNPSTCANILKTMVDRGYVTKVYPHKTYTLGPMVYQLPQRRNYKRSLVHVAHPHMAQLAERQNETVVLTIIENGRFYIIDEVRSARLPAIPFDPLHIRNIMSKATTRVLLAHLGQPEREALLSGMQIVSGAAVTIKATDERLDERQLDEIAQQPVHCHADCHDIGYAAPIWQNDKVIAALGLYLPRSRSGSIDEAQLTQAITVCAEAIGQSLLQ
ncbi:MAG: helix-turn-helix domain-containing protein [Bacillota bacterium]|nr:helix-turn-helix domain-containing protein [Bacillota bacterium]